LARAGTGSPSGPVRISPSYSRLMTRQERLPVAAAGSRLAGACSTAIRKTCPLELFDALGAEFLLQEGKARVQAVISAQNDPRMADALMAVSPKMVSLDYRGLLNSCQLDGMRSV